jgi:hypothetical protein
MGGGGLNRSILTVKIKFLNLIYRLIRGMFCNIYFADFVDADIFLIVFHSMRVGYDSSEVTSWYQDNVSG